MKAIAALLALTACASSAPLPRTPPPHVTARTPPTVEPEPIGKTLALGDARPEVRAAIEVDAASIPLGKWGAPLTGSSFRMSADMSMFHVEGTRYAEVSVGNFSAFTDTAVSTVDWPQCHRAGSAMALWRGFSLDTWSEDGLDVTMSRGPFDFGSCTASATTSLVKTALGIVPGFVYALRVDDSLYVVLPSASFASATHNATGSGAFASATLPCRPHHESAAAMRIGPQSVRTWQSISTFGAYAELASFREDPAQSLLVIVEVRARGDGNVVAISAAVPDATSEDAFTPFFSAMRRVTSRENSHR